MFMLLHNALSQRFPSQPGVATIIAWEIGDPWREWASMKRRINLWKLHILHLAEVYLALGLVLPRKPYLAKGVISWVIAMHTDPKL